MALGGAREQGVQERLHELIEIIDDEKGEIGAILASEQAIQFDEGRSHTGEPWCQHVLDELRLVGAQGSSVRSPVVFELPVGEGEILPPLFPDQGTRIYTIHGSE